MSNEVRVPKFVKPSKKDIEKTLERPKLREGWYRFLSTGAKQTVSDAKGTMMVSFQNLPLEKPTDTKSGQRKFKVRNSVCMPVANPDREGHEAPNTSGIVYDFLRAVAGADPKDPLYVEDIPRPVKGERGKYLDAKTKKTLNEAEATARKVEIFDKVFDKCAEIWTKPNLLDDLVYYGKVVHNESGFTNIVSPSATLPEGEQLVPRNRWLLEDEDEDESDDDDEEEEEEEEKPVAPKKGAKKGK